MSFVAPSKGTLLVWMDVPVASRLSQRLDGYEPLVTFVEVSNGSADRLDSAGFVITRKTPLTRDQLQTMRDVRTVSAWGIGYDHIDVEAAASLGIEVVHNPVFSHSVAEAALTLVLALSKQLLSLNKSALEGTTFEEADVDSQRNLEIAGRTVTVVGYGRIGRRLGHMTDALGMKVVAVDPYLDPDSLPDGVTRLDLDTALPESDFVVLTVPLSKATRHMINRRRLRSMKPGSFLVNVGRGPLVDEGALLEALDKHLGGAGLDVWEDEPVRPTNPLLLHPKVIGTPHALARSVESLERICDSIAANIKLTVDSAPLQNPVQVLSA